jgi:hypothetical protein
MARRCTPARVTSMARAAATIPLGRRQRLDVAARRTDAPRTGPRRRTSVRLRLRPCPLRAGSSERNGQGAPSIWPTALQSSHARRVRPAVAQWAGSSRRGPCPNRPGAGTGLTVGPRPVPLPPTPHCPRLARRCPRECCPTSGTVSTSGAGRAGVAATMPSAGLIVSVDPNRHAVVVHRGGTSGRRDECAIEGAGGGVRRVVRWWTSRCATVSQRADIRPFLKRSRQARPVIGSPTGIHNRPGARLAPLLGAVAPRWLTADDFIATVATSVQAEVWRETSDGERFRRSRPGRELGPPPVVPSGRA